MKAIFISCNQALYDEVQQKMASLGVRGYTSWEELMGAGMATGEPHLGSTTDRKSTRLYSSHSGQSRMPSSA